VFVSYKHLKEYFSAELPNYTVW